MARLPEEVRLTVVGDGSERTALERLAADLGVDKRITFEGHRPHDEVWRYYRQGGVFVFPSVRESGGGVVLEAMSYGLPCLVAAWGGPLLYTASTGVHLRVDSAQVLQDDLVAAVHRLLEDPEEARRIGERSRAVIAEQYLWQGKVAQLHRHAMATITR
jgi:glycosyltransferase involved in cell wall biosynthesis